MNRAGRRAHARLLVGAGQTVQYDVGRLGLARGAMGATLTSADGTFVAFAQGYAGAARVPERAGHPTAPRGAARGHRGPTASDGYDDSRARGAGDGDTHAPTARQSNGDEHAPSAGATAHHRDRADQHPHSDGDRADGWRRDGNGIRDGSADECPGQHGDSNRDSNRDPNGDGDPIHATIRDGDPIPAGADDQHSSWHGAANSVPVHDDDPIRDSSSDGNTIRNPTGNGNTYPIPDGDPVPDGDFYPVPDGHCQPDQHGVSHAHQDNRAAHDVNAHAHDANRTRDRILHSGAHAHRDGHIRSIDDGHYASHQQPDGHGDTDKHSQCDDDI